MRGALLLLLALLLQAAPPEPSAEAIRAALPGLQGQARILALHDLVNKVESRAPQEGLALANEGLTLSRAAGDKEKEAAFLSSMAFCYSQTGDFALAVLRGKESLELSRQIGNKDRIARAHNTLGITYTYMGMYSQALEEHLESLRIRDELSLETASLQSLNNIGVLYHNIGQYEKAIYYFQKSLDRNVKIHDMSRHILLKLNIGFAHYKLGRLAEALKYHLEAMDLIHSTNNRTMIAYAYYNLGMTCTDLRQFAKARQYLDLALTEYKKQDQKHARVQVLIAMGRFHLLTGNPSRGISQVKEAIQVAQNIKSRNDLMIGYELLSELYTRQQNPADSYKYFKLYVATKNTIYTSQESKKIAEILANIVNLRKDHELESLKTEQVIASLKLEKGRYVTTFLLISLGFLVTATFVLVISNYRAKRTKVMMEQANADLGRLNADLREKVEEIKTLSGLLPICSHCKKIRNDSGYWMQLEGYISEHTSATFTHGICPPCANMLYPGAMQSIKGKRVGGGGG